jgi:hypothetical protein
VLFLGDQKQVYYLSPKLSWCATCTPYFALHMLEVRVVSVCGKGEQERHLGNTTLSFYSHKASPWETL